MQSSLVKSTLNLMVFFRTYSARMTSSKPSVLLTRNDYPEEGVKLLREHFEVDTWKSSLGISKEELTSALNEKFAVFCSLSDKIDADVLKNASDLKVIATMSVGYDHLDLKEIKQRNIRVGYTPNVLTEATAELTMALLLATSRRILESHNAIHKGEWKSWAPNFMCGPALQNSTVGIVGCGRIGLSVLEKLIPYKVSKFLYTSRNKKPEVEKHGAIHTDIDNLCRESDFIILTSALTPDTHQLINRTRLESMKPTAILINTSRGQLVDQAALIDVLRDGKIRAAGLDVMYPEPLPLDSPLLKLDNCVIIPHIGSAQIETRQEMARITAQNIINVFQNKPMIYEVPL
uniref:Glyoxylate reductase/hydroxypyruvate reductase n=3 Tax=Cacopsylla melanoneura TaxID=428564 RepID=A0A8D8TFJ0_9HEMI